MLFNKIKLYFTAKAKYSQGRIYLTIFIPIYKYMNTLVDQTH